MPPSLATTGAEGAAQTRGFRALGAACAARATRAGAHAAAPLFRVASYVGQAWKGDKENPQSNAAAAKTIFTTVAIYACFLGLSSASPLPARGVATRAAARRAAAALRQPLLRAAARALPCTRCHCAGADWLPALLRGAVLCFMGHAAKRKIAPDTGRRRA